MVTGGVKPTIAEKRAGRPIVTRILGMTGDLFRSSSSVPLNPTRRWVASSGGSHPSSRPAAIDQGFADGVGRPLNNVAASK